MLAPCPGPNTTEPFLVQQVRPLGVSSTVQPFDVAKSRTVSQVATASETSTALTVAAPLGTGRTTTRPCRRHRTMA